VAPIHLVRNFISGSTCRRPSCGRSGAKLRRFVQRGTALAMQMFPDQTLGTPPIPPFAEERDTTAEFSTTGSSPPLAKGMTAQNSPNPPSTPRSPRRGGRPLPSRIPSKSAHSGKMAETTAKSSACNRASSARAHSLRFHLFTIFLRDLTSSASWLALQLLRAPPKIPREHRLLWIDHHIDGGALKRRPPQPHRFAQAALDPVPFDRSAEDATHGETDAGAVRQRSSLGRGVHVRRDGSRRR
jgi:hypothetical protein